MAYYVHLNVIKKRGKSMKLNEQDLIKIQGGLISASLLNAFSRAITTILGLGRTVGSAIRRIYSKNYC